MRGWVRACFQSPYRVRWHGIVALRAAGATEAHRLSQPPKVQLKQRYEDWEAFCFQGSKTCRLCGELAVDPAAHMGMLRHACRVTFLQYMLPIALRGGDVEGVTRDWWPLVLYRASRESRIVSLSAQHEVDARASALRRTLRALRELGVLSSSVFTPQSSAQGATSRGHAFERFENIGDTAWSSHTAKRLLLLFPHAGWTNDCAPEAGDFHGFRDYLESNDNLEKAFDLLELGQIAVPGGGGGGSTATMAASTPPTSSNVQGEAQREVAKKFKADVIEAICGELRMHLWSRRPLVHATGGEDYVAVNGLQIKSLVALIDHTLEELYDLLALVSFVAFGKDTKHVMKELIAEQFDKPLPSHLKFRAPFPVSRKMATASKITFKLPPAAALHTASTKLQRSTQVPRSVYVTQRAATRFALSTTFERVDVDGRLSRAESQRAYWMEVNRSARFIDTLAMDAAYNCDGLLHSAPMPLCSVAGNPHTAVIADPTSIV